MAMKGRNFTSLKGVGGFQEPRININYSPTSFPLVVFVEKVTYNLVNLKDQNSLNIDHNANPTFSLMNNQSNPFEDTKGFILDTSKDMKLNFFLLTFGICCVFLQLKLLLPFLELIGILLPFHFFFFFAFT
jgi:hypothetical protein